MPIEKHKSAAAAASHVSSVRALEQGDAETMLHMALDSATPPEMLVFLSQAQDRNIRTAVAGNPSAPAAIDLTLAEDADPMVRAALTTRFTAQMPELSNEDAQKFADRAGRILLRLADDTDIAVRRILSEEICRLEGIPKQVILKLAGDIDDLVAVPVCQFSPILSDEDLIGLVSSRGSPAARKAIARREGLGAEVSATLVDTGDIDAIGALLNNKSAHIRETTLDAIVERAEGVPSWHEALCGRPEITSSLAIKLAAFVATALIGQLAARQDLDAETVAYLTTAVTEALARDDAASAQDDTMVDVPSEQDICAAIEKRRESLLVRLIAARARTGSSVVRRILAARIPKAIIALAWKTGLTMKTAERLQRYPATIPEKRIIKCSDDGRYPLNETDMEWQLATYGLDTEAPTDMPNGGNAVLSS